MKKAKSTGATFVEVMIVLVAIWAVAPFLGKFSCDQKAGRLGFNHEWTLMGGCMIEPKPGQWIPLANYRVL